MKQLSRNFRLATMVGLMMAMSDASVAGNTNVDGAVVPSADPAGVAATDRAVAAEEANPANPHADQNAANAGQGAGNNNAAPVYTSGAPTVLSVEEQEAKDKKDAADKATLFEGIKAKFNNLVDIRETNFNFRTVKDAKTGIETKRPTVALPVPVPSLEGIVEILSKGPGKEVDLLVEAVTAVILEQAREYINEHEEVNADNFPYEMLSWETIANLPKAERRGGGISKEVWEDFAKDYVEVMPGVTGKKKESVEMAAKVFVAKFAGATTNKPVLKLLQQQLAVYASNTTQGEQFAPCIEFLMNKLEKLLNTDETNLLLAL
jgi:hypothetical protein